MKYPRIGVVGAGTIGRGVALNLALTDHSVTLVDITQPILDDAMNFMAKDLKSAALFDAAIRARPHHEILRRIATSAAFEDLAGADFVIENVTESWPVKAPIYGLLDRLCREDCIIAANTSAIPISQLAGATRREDRILGIHFMNPVRQKPVVEVIRAENTSEATIAGAMELLKQMGKTAILVNDKPGFVSNRVLMLTINEAIHVLQDGVAEAKDIDAIFVQCFAHKMGPLATADLIGLDTILNTLEVLQESYQLEKYAACPLLRDMVRMGHIGRKSGKGFYNYGFRGKS
jgi:3-hydroxybutyryl-CoA dehydrogenase